MFPDTFAWGAAVVAVAIVMVTIVFDRHDRRRQALREGSQTMAGRRQEVELQERTLALQERQLAHQQATDTADARTALELAQLSLKEAEARLRAQLLSDPDVLQAKKQEELRVIKGVADARIAAAQNEASTAGSQTLKPLLETYRAYLDNMNGDQEMPTFDDWLGTLRTIVRG